ncbi:MAG: branched-chain amino acid ABC transporter permease [Acidimicrobiales bacterium]
MDWGHIVSETLRAAVGQEAIVFALAAIGLNLHFGYTGLLNFGQAGFLAMGAYSTGICVEYLHWSLWAGVAVGIVAAILLAVILGLPTLRLRADYLAIVTIAAAEIIRLIARSVTFGHITGGSSGINGYADAFYEVNPLGDGTYGFGPWRFDEDRLWVLIVGWTLVALASLVVFLLVRSPWGRVIKSIREDEDAARSLGKNVYAYKMQSLVVGGVIGAFGGMVFAIGNQSVQADNYGTATTFLALTAVILGGTSRVPGPVVGAMILWAVISFTENILRQASAEGLLPTSIISGTQVGIVRFMLVGVALMALPIFRPQGIFGNRREITFESR